MCRKNASSCRFSVRALSKSAGSFGTNSPPNFHQGLASMIATVSNQIFIKNNLLFGIYHDYCTSAILESTLTFASFDSRAGFLHTRIPLDRSHQHGANSHNRDFIASDWPVHDHDIPSVL